MTKYREILRLANLGINQTSIATSCGCARKTVRDVLNKAKALDISWPLQAETTDADLKKLLFPDKSVPKTDRKYPDYDYIDKEMMHIPRKPGEQIEVDWAGDPAHIIDTDTDELISCHIFVGVLNYSLYAYVEAFLSMDMESWITAHIHMYHHFGGSTTMLIPDNLKTGVEHSDWFSPKINKTYNEMAEHYDTAVLPARVRAPKDKPSAEGTVNVISTWITAAIRNEKFFSLEELNCEIHRRLKDFNHKPFQKKEGSRYSVFLVDEKPFLTPLPSAPFELSQWKQATVQFNYHISVDKMQYSVPYEYIKQVVDVRLTRTVVEVFYHNQRICSHTGRITGFIASSEKHRLIKHRQM